MEADDSHQLSWADEMSESDYSDWLKSKAEDLRCLPTLDPWVQEFLTGEELP